MHEMSHLNVIPSAAQRWKRLALTLVYASAMGLLEAVCVIYLRRLLWPHGMESGAPPLNFGIRIEVIREVSTIVMLATVAGLAGGTIRSQLSAFFIMFGVWDILYYVGLWWLSGWPESVLTWDCLFLIPKPWYGPVLAPVLVSVAFIIGCAWAFLAEERGQRLSPTLMTWGLLTASMGVWYWSFVKDSEAIRAHGYTGIAYSWPLFALGTAFFAAAFIHLRIQIRRTTDQTLPPTTPSPTQPGTNPPSI
jgi:hypothetical protein